MKKIKLQICLLLLVVGLLGGGAMEACAAKSTQKKPAVTAEKKTKIKKKGWETTSKGKRYYKKGKYLTGLQKISSKYYYFSQKGYMQKGTIKAGKWTYYTTLDSVVDGKKKGKNYYTMEGKKLTGEKKKDYETKLRARKAAMSITNDKMSLAEKRLACFQWVSRHPYQKRRTFRRFSGWMSTYADDHFLYGRGNCVSDACAFAYLAQAIGYKNVYVCLDADNDDGHSWCEIGGRVFDPLFAEVRAYGFNRCYNASYSVYPDPWPTLHLKLS